MIDIKCLYTGETLKSIDADSLSRANLCEADLRGANLSRANLRWTDLSGANLRWTDLSGADLRWADLSGADLRWADLREADLRGTNLRGAIGNNAEIKRLQSGHYAIAYTKTIMAIGCEQHSIDQWFAFEDQRILSMDGKTALKFWRKWKPILQAIMAD